MMLDYLKNNPARKLNRNILILGLLIFVPVYTYIVQLFGKMGIDTAEFNGVWLSFDASAFKIFFLKLEDLGQLQGFIWTFNLNLISMTGFMLTFFSLSLMLARQLPEGTRLAKYAFIFPIVAIAIAVLDIIPTLVFLLASSGIPDLSTLVIYTISGGYVTRVILLYILLLWMIIAGISLLVTKIRGAKT
ncbi:MAG: hypothetical protein HN995_11985 [Candidatus Marinimicrobia bacterium]|jgi:hypothetical protein|nr:hypothetical protein [Candidatus Neomarinimicrobiota bacterium]MBT3576385.1 hypothetical protein [Candidatus Neomarinimicrobiota bacterium]MBT3680083.1 hypothetical protein [Candidatus Neomarinimicrobiota bacterium]MBT3950068.1 hypothetical protein [Candidatus Neomarinimicrobiota bacterium]MBT4254367.1 hypothetical protein [Candidatus Neomarinimicrobiota bacterium]